MVKLAANLSFLFTELPFLDRFEAAARAGFEAVEFAFAYDVPVREIARRLRDHGLALVLINMPPGDLPAGDLGLAVAPGREDELFAALDRALEYAAALNVPLIHFLAGARPAGVPIDETEALFLRNLSRAADIAAMAGRTLTLEPLNARDRPGYFLRTNGQARALIAACGKDNVRLQLDLYHCQISEGELIRALESNLDILAHVQIAGVPDRGEPDAGETACLEVLGRLDRMGYAGFVGCEYVPAAGTLAGLGWARPFLAPGDARR